MNSSQKCKGKITRQRVTKNKKEESIIDFVLVCELMDDMVEELLIDEDKKYALTSYSKTKIGTKVKESDHNSLITKITAVTPNFHKPKRKIHSLPQNMYQERKLFSCLP